MASYGFSTFCQPRRIWRNWRNYIQIGKNIAHVPLAAQTLLSGLSSGATPSLKFVELCSDRVQTTYSGCVMLSTFLIQTLKPLRPQWGWKNVLELVSRIASESFTTPIQLPCNSLTKRGFAVVGAISKIFLYFILVLCTLRPGDDDIGNFWFHQWMNSPTIYHYFILSDEEN